MKKRISNESDIGTTTVQIVFDPKIVTYWKRSRKEYVLCAIGLVHVQHDEEYDLVSSKPLVPHLHPRNNDILLKYVDDTCY